MIFLLSNAPSKFPSTDEEYDAHLMSDDNTIYRVCS